MKSLKKEQTQKSTKVKRSQRQYELATKRMIVEEIRSGRLVLVASAKKYNIPVTTISTWLKFFSNDFSEMKAKKMKPEEEQELEKLRREKQSLEKDLELARLKCLAFEMLVDMAEKEFNIDIKKNSGSK